MQGPRFAFGQFVLDTEAGVLLRNDVPVPISHRGVLLLAAFVRRPAQVLTKSDLMEAAWQNAAVEESNLTVQIALLRKALGPAPDGGECIGTVPRVGYRFLLRVEQADRPPVDALPLPAKPSIAVLPFANGSNDAGQEVFADGLTEDLITDLSRDPGLFVIARNSAFAYKGKAMDVRTIAAELGVRYLLEGSIRRVAGRVRINVELVDAVSGGHAWAERFDRDLEDIFAVQNEVTGKIVDALTGRLARPSAPRRPRSLEAYDLWARARMLLDESPQSTREAQLLLKRALELDPDYAAAHALLAQNRWMAWLHWGEPIDPNRALSLQLAERAVSLDPNDAGCRRILGNVLAHEGRWAESDAEFAAALELDPNHADALADLSDLTVLAGKIPEGLEYIQKALRLNPHPPTGYYWTLGQAQYAARDYARAIETLRREDTYRTGARRYLAASLAQAGRLDEARREAELFLIGNPHFSIRHWVATQPFRDAATREHFLEGFRKAGLPE